MEVGRHRQRLMANDLGACDWGPTAGHTVRGRRVRQVLVIYRDL